MTNIIDGKKIAGEIKQEIAFKVKALKESGKRAPHLAIIISGDDGASHTYVGGKINACKAVGNFPTLVGKLMHAKLSVLILP